MALGKPSRSVHTPYALRWCGVKQRKKIHRYTLPQRTEEMANQFHKFDIFIC